MVCASPDNHGEDINGYLNWNVLCNKYPSENLNDVAEEIIKYTIYTNRYCYDGYYHQYGDYGSFVFEDCDGCQYLWFSSMRYFCGIMSDVWNMLDKETHFDYLDFYMNTKKIKQMLKTPNSETEFLDKMDKFLTKIHNCEKCGKFIPWDSYANGFGLCLDCFYSN